MAPIPHLALACGLALSGCSIPIGAGGKHLTVGYARSSNHPLQVQTVVPGLDVRVGTGHDGVNLGWSSLLVAAPLHTSETNTSVASRTERGWHYEPPFALEKSDGAQTRRVGWFLWQRGSPSLEGCRFIAEEHVGLALGLNRHLKGLEIGVGRQTWLLASRNSDGAWRLSFQSGVMGVTCLEEQTQNQIELK